MDPFILIEKGKLNENYFKVAFILIEKGKLNENYFKVAWN